MLRIQFDLVVDFAKKLTTKYEIKSTGILHISYAPEYETLDDVRNKIELRKNEIKYRLKALNRGKQVESLARIE